MREISFLKQNILKYLEFKGVTKYEFYQKTGISNGILSQNNGLSEENILRFLSYYKDVNPEWLITGNGEMIKPNIQDTLPLETVRKTVRFSEETKSIENHTVSNEPAKEHEGIPLIPIDAMAGFGTGGVQVMDYDTQKYIVPEFTELKVDFMIRVKGSSMYPKYNSGDLVACKKLVLNDIFFQWNKVYVLDTDQGALIKRIKKGSEDNLLIVSDNPSYEPYELHLSKIHAIAIVLGVIRLE
jgi:repressor LexA